MSNTQKIDYRGQQFGPFIAIEPAARKRYWKLRCEKGHITERRMDILKRTKPELLRCPVCSAPAPLQTSINDAQKEALALLARTLDLTVKACGGVLAAFGKSAA